MSKNYIKAAIIVIIILLIYFGLMYFVFGNNASSDPGNNPTPPATTTKYLIKDINNIWSYDNTWKSSEVDDVNNKEFNIYIDHKLFGAYTIKEGEVWNLFDNDNNYVSYKGDFYAASKDLNITFPNVKEGILTDTEFKEINSILNMDITISDLVTNELIYVDLDENNMLDKIVLVSNFNYVTADKTYYTLAYVNLNGEIKVLVNDKIDNENLTQYTKYTDIDIINLNNSDVDNIVLKKEHFSLTGHTEYDIYTYNDNQFQKLI